MQRSRWIALAAAILTAAAAVVGWRTLFDEHAAEDKSAASPSSSFIAAAAPDVLKYASSAPQLSMIQTEVVRDSPLPLTDTLNARLVYDEDVTARIGVSISGRVVAILVEPGDMVKAGQPLVEIDSPDVGTALADLDKARADEARKQLAAERARQLAPDDAMAAKDVESAHADLAQARAEIQRAQQRLNNLNPSGLSIQGQRIKVLSPITGVVAERNVNPAMEVSAGMPVPLFVLTDPGRLWLMIDLPEKLLAHVALGAAVEVESDAYPDQRFVAKVVQRGTVVDPNSRRATLRARLDNPGRRLLPEMFVRARLLQDRGRAIRVPNTAIVNRGLYAQVFVEASPGEFQRIKVRLASQGAEFSYVVDGLRGDERLVTAGALLLDAELNAAAPAKP